MGAGSRSRKRNRSTLCRLRPGRESKMAQSTVSKRANSESSPRRNSIRKKRTHLHRRGG